MRSLATAGQGERRTAPLGRDRGGEGPEARFSLTPAAFARTTVAVASSQIDTLALVDPGKPDRSYLLMKVTGDPRIQGKRMPLIGKLSTARWVCGP